MASQNAKKPVLQVKSLSMVYNNRKVLDSLNLHVLDGEIFGLIGMSGSGKTTFLELLIGFLEPSEGEILYSARLLEAKSEDFVSLADNRDQTKRVFGFATQTPSFYDHLTVKENLEYFGTLYDLSTDIIQKNIATLLDVVGIASLQDILAGNLSSGMKKRLDIACALVHNPKILILDEPTADLDVVGRKQIWGLVKRINTNGTTIIIASHLLDEIETLCDNIAVLHNRRIVSKGGVNALRQLYADHEEVHFQTAKADYQQYKTIFNRPELKVERMIQQGRRLIVFSATPKEVLHYLLHFADNLHDEVVDVSISKPSLNDIFERITKEK